MSKQIIQEVTALLNEGYVQYRGDVDQALYDALRCRKEKSAVWFRLDNKYRCLGCKRHCSQVGNAGFQIALTLKVKPDATTRVAFAEIPAVNAIDLLNSKVLLRVDEVAYVTSMSERTVRDRIDEGVFRRHPDKAPVRVYSESVKAYLGLD